MVTVGDRPTDGCVSDTVAGLSRDSLSFVNVPRRCCRPGCPHYAVATLTFVYSDSTAVVGPLATVSEPHSWDLCVSHAGRITAPRGWELVRHAGKLPSHPDEDDLIALAEAVREGRTLGSVMGEVEREMGVRVALGARRSDVLGLVLREGMRLALSGVAIGLILAAVATRLIAGFLFDVSALDAATFAGMSVLFIVVALVAIYLPARRAASSDPMSALRAE
jgi:hypothetical protein